MPVAYTVFPCANTNRKGYAMYCSEEKERSGHMRLDEHTIKELMQCNVGKKLLRPLPSKEMHRGNYSEDFEEWLESLDYNNACNNAKKLINFLKRK